MIAKNLSCNVLSAATFSYSSFIFDMIRFSFRTASACIVYGKALKNYIYTLTRKKLLNRSLNFLCHILCCLKFKIRTFNSI